MRYIATLIATVLSYPVGVLPAQWEEPIGVWSW